MSLKDKFFDAAERAASLVNEKYLDKWVEGAIFPSEMAFFLASCEAFGISRVIESGRQDGYSTEILADWAEIHDLEVISIDLELEKERAAACRKKLHGRSIVLVKGSAYENFGKLSLSCPDKPTAFLVDGPKGWPALSMMSASLASGTRLVAIHNLSEGEPTRDLFLGLGGASVFYEHALKGAGPEWNNLRQREVEFLTKRGAVRDLGCSSLGVLRLNGKAKDNFYNLRGAQFGLHQPKLVRALYKVRLFSLITKLYGVSYKFLGR